MRVNPKSIARFGLNVELNRPAVANGTSVLDGLGRRLGRPSYKVLEYSSAWPESQLDA
jgi:hypothetical protein